MNDSSKKITSIGFILDGNRRWAKERNLPTLEGHRKGYENLKDVISWCKDAGIEHVVAYVFSTENWKRSSEEVSYLMDLIRTILVEELSKIRGDEVAVHVAGDVTLFPEDIQNSILEMEDSNPKNAQHHVWLAASYGGRPEIVAGVNALLSQGVKSVTAEEFAKVLWTGGLPDPDIIVRTGGEKRLSNFLAWSGVYSELFFLDVYWPAFSKKDFEAVLAEFRERDRRHGK